MSAPSRADGATRALGEPLTFWRPDAARAPADPPRISVADLVSFLGKGGPRHGRSLVHGVASLPAWHAIHTSPSGERDTIPDLPFSDLPPRLPALADAARAVRRAVRNTAARAAGDARRIGLQLSGGLDSTILAAVLAELGREVVCYTAEPDRGGPREWRRAAAVADGFGFRSRRVPVPCGEIEAAAANLSQRHPNPVLCWVVASQQRIAARAAEDGCEVLLSGLGADEVFGGYPDLARFTLALGRLVAERGRDEAVRTLRARSGRFGAPLFVGVCRPFPKAALARVFPEVDVAGCIEADAAEVLGGFIDGAPGACAEACAMALDVGHRVADILLPELAAASTVFPGRLGFPFLDREVLRTAAVIPAGLEGYAENVPGIAARAPGHGRDKPVLRAAFDEAVPDRVKARPRSAYTLPYQRLLARDGRAEAVIDRIVRSPLWDAVGAHRPALTGLFAGSLAGDQWAAPFRIWVGARLVDWWEAGGVERIFRASAPA